MVKFITRTICMALITVLCVGNANAQLVKTVDPKAAVSVSALSSVRIVSETTPAPRGMVNVTLAAGDVWGDGTGYQMLLDADHNTYGSTIPATGALYTSCSAPATLYDVFEYKIPTNANPVCATQNIVFNTSITIQIPAGTYDFCIANPTPGDRIWIASGDNGRKDDYVFEDGKKYTFTVTLNSSTGNDNVDLLVEVDTPGNPCPAVTNVNAVQFKGTSAKVTWTAPSNTTGLTGYKIYDGSTELGTVAVGETTFITAALTTGDHIIAVEAQYPDCDPVKVTKTVTIKTCGSAITGVDVQYSTDCKATVTWNAVTSKDISSEMLWDNTNINVSTGGLISSYWSGNDNWVYVADDFVADGAWTIEQVNTNGFSNSPSILPTKYAIAIYNDNAGKPGTEIYSNKALPITGGTSEEPTIALPQPFQLPSAGTYWISIAGAYDATVNTNSEASSYRWNIFYGPTQIGANYCLWDKGGMFGSGTTWMDASGLVAGSYSMYFSLEGSKNSGPVTPKYNVYKGDELVAEGIEETTYTATTAVEAGVDIEWCVTQVCQAGGESAAGCKTAKCNDTPPPPPCNPVTDAAVEINAGCTEATITWTPVEGAEMYQVIRSDVSIPAMVGVPPYIETDTYQNGTTYKWTITTICSNGNSEGVEVSKTVECVGISEIENNVSIYPNPATSTVTINARDFVKVEVYNAVGQLMTTTYEHLVDVSAYNTGIYFFKVYDANNNTVTKRVMVSK